MEEFEAELGAKIKVIGVGGGGGNALNTMILAGLKNAVDTLITIPNQRLLAIADEKTTLLDTFKKADEVLLNAVQGISDLITIPGLINVDFADVRTIMSSMGCALMGTGTASGEGRALLAARAAVESPLLE